MNNKTKKFIENESLSDEEFDFIMQIVKIRHEKALKDIIFSVLVDSKKIHKVYILMYFFLYHKLTTINIKYIINTQKRKKDMHE